MIRLVSLFISFGLLSATAHADTIVIDFESFPGGSVEDILVEDGFFIDPALAPALPAISNVEGSQSILFCGWCNPTEGISIYSTIGVVFELDSLDSFITNSGWVYTGLVTGYLDGGGTVTQAIDTTMGTVNFDQSWVNLTSVDIVYTTGREQTDFTVPGIDNIVLQAVPIPAAVWMFASGLGLLGWLRRR